MRVQTTDQSVCEYLTSSIHLCRYITCAAVYDTVLSNSFLEPLSHLIW